MGPWLRHQSIYNGWCISRYFVEFVAPVPAQDGPVGIIPFIVDSAMHGDLSQVLFRAGQLPSVFGLIITSVILLILVYVQVIHVDIPIVSTKYRGFTAVYPIKLLYTSNIPVILSFALVNAVFMGQMLWQIITLITRTLSSMSLHNMILANHNLQLEVFCITSLHQEVLRLQFRTVVIVVYVFFLTSIVTVFGRLWVELGGLSAQKAAKNLLDADVQVPGFRRAEDL